MTPGSGTDVSLQQIINNGCKTTKCINISAREQNLTEGGLKCGNGGIGCFYRGISEVICNR